MIEVKNKKTYSGEGEYIGRPSIIGNPFTHIPKGTLAKFIVRDREEAVSKYEAWIREEMVSNEAIKKEINRLVDKYRIEGKLILICWCSPLACHGDVIKKIIEERLENDRPTESRIHFSDDEEKQLLGEASEDDRSSSPSGKVAR